jgi:hypothetical protein
MKSLVIVIVLLLVGMSVVSARPVEGELLKEREKSTEKVISRFLKNSKENRANLDKALQEISVKQKDLNIRIDVIQQSQPVLVEIQTLDDIINFNVDEFGKEVDAKFEADLKWALSQAD